MIKSLQEELSMITVREATVEEVERWWDNHILENADNNSHKVWKESFVSENKNGRRKTFYAWDGNKNIGQGTLVFESDDKNLTGDGKAEIIKLEVVEEYRNRKISSLIYSHIKDYAKQKGIHALTIGVEPCEVRNMQIYFHWGFTNFIQCITEIYPPEKEGETGETITVLCYSKQI